ncbi:dipeptidase [Qipengyuania sediminis]|uniref:dipeptidase n=1 Tax=Qipengyuania sediminis TaxID=1532023 RepID=UPI001059E9A2|nr:dipeptidase [Qipengyuania sediminis]
MTRLLARSALTLAALALPAALTAQSRPPEKVAEAALRAAPVFDGHNDVPWALRERYRNVIAGFDFNDSTKAPDPGGEGPMHTDIRRLKQGRVGAQFWSVYVPMTLSEPQAVVAVMEQIDVTKRLLARHPDVFALVTTADGVEAAMKRGRIASIMGMEGGNSIGESLAVLRQTYDLGVRYLTLTHNKTLSWADAATDAPKHEGLNDFGRQVVREMNRLGMLVDLSHVSEATMMDALDESRAPVIFSHSGARAVNGHARNVPDAVLRRLPANGGVVMVVGLPGFLGEELRQHAAGRAGEQARQESLWRGQPAAVTQAMAAWDAANPPPKVGLSVWADHIDHIRKVAGIDHIGIGGDYDGMPSGPVGAEDVAGYPALFAELARRGYTQAELEKIANRNIMRALRGAEATAARMKAMPPIETPAVGTGG